MNPVPVPEPATMLLPGVGLIGVAGNAGKGFNRLYIIGTRVFRFMFFQVDSRELLTLYVDHIRVEAAR